MQQKKSQVFEHFFTFCITGFRTIIFFAVCHFLLRKKLTTGCLAIYKMLLILWLQSVIKDSDDKNFLKNSQCSFIVPIFQVIVKIVRKRSRIGHQFPYEIKTNIPNFFHIDIVTVLEVRYVCFDFIWKLMAYSGSHPYSFQPELKSTPANSYGIGPKKTKTNIEKVW